MFTPVTPGMKTETVLLALSELEAALAAATRRNTESVKKYILANEVELL